uniref:Uncharacterized protein n=1 Tax=Globisporangium ultimum (strain ATCC 200006 / CBS 805.95 / DAOM BR144) TaxID=431595 RepID=K3W8T3_GLOUD
MSFLPWQDEQTLLDDALAFIDGWDGESDHSLSPPWFGDSSPTHSQVASSSISSESLSDSPESRSSRKYRKNEIEELCEQVLHLTDQLAYFKKCSGNMGIVELEKRQQAESVNRKLKKAIEKQAKFAHTLQKMFRKQTANHDLVSLLQWRSPNEELLSLRKQKHQHQHQQIATINVPDDVMPSNAQVFDALYQYLDTSYQEVANVFASITLRNTMHAFSTSSVQQDPKLGQVYEFTANTPLPCSLQQLDKYLWTRLTYLDTATETTGSVFARTHSQIYAEKTASGSCSTMEDASRMEYLRDFLQHALSDKMRNLQLRVQSIMLEDIETIQAGGTMPVEQMLIESTAC